MQFIFILISSWATIPLMYPASFLFSVPSSAFVTLACANLFIGIITTITVFVLENFDDEELEMIGDILKYVFLIFPQFCLGRGLMEMGIEHSKSIVAQQFGKIAYCTFSLGLPCLQQITPNHCDI